MLDETGNGKANFRRMMYWNQNMHYKVVFKSSQSNMKMKEVQGKDNKKQKQLERDQTCGRGGALGISIPPPTGGRPVPRSHRPWLCQAKSWTLPLTLLQHYTTT